MVHYYKNEIRKVLIAKYRNINNFAKVFSLHGHSVEQALNPYRGGQMQTLVEICELLELKIIIIQKKYEDSTPHKLISINVEKEDIKSIQIAMEL